MEKNNTLRENISWLLQQYKKALEEENKKDIDEQKLDFIWDCENIIIELEYALKISK